MFGPHQYNNYDVIGILYYINELFNCIVQDLFTCRLCISLRLSLEILSVNHNILQPALASHHFILLHRLQYAQMMELTAIATSMLTSCQQFPYLNITQTHYQLITYIPKLNFTSGFFEGISNSYGVRYKPKPFITVFTFVSRLFIILTIYGQYTVVFKLLKFCKQKVVKASLALPIYSILNEAFCGHLPIEENYFLLLLSTKICKGGYSSMFILQSNELVLKQ